MIPLVLVVGNALNVPPVHIEATGVKVGVTFGLTVIVSVVGIAHWPTAGVKVYVVVVVLSNPGLQLPVMPLLLVAGNTFNAPPIHIAATGVKVGVIFPLLAPIVIVATDAH